VVVGGEHDEVVDEKAEALDRGPDLAPLLLEQRIDAWLTKR